jgi:Mg-chelatase subunit ChlD
VPIADHRRNIVLAGLGLWLAVAGGRSAAQAVPQGSDLAERARARAYRVRVRIEPTWVAEPGECLGFGIDDLKVSLRGKRISDPALLRLDRELEPTVHVLLLDTSRSMAGRMEFVREAAIDYVRRLDPGHEQGLVIGFDDTVHLYRGVTSSHDLLIEAIGDVRMSYGTSLYDALIYTMQETSLYRARSVVLLLTDGVDGGSLHQRIDVLDMLDEPNDATIFAIGLGLPPITRAFVSTRKFLQQLAMKTNGKFFDVPTIGTLDDTYRRIREILDNEAILTVVDPEPDAEPGKLRVVARGEGCKARVLRDDAEATSAPLREISSAKSLPIRPDPVLVNPLRELRVDDTEEEICPDGSWVLDVDERRLSGCVYDITMDYGLLYDPFPFSWVSLNAWLRLRNRPFEIPVPSVAELPDRPEQLMADLARRARVVADFEVDTDPRRQPPEDHARPSYDYPGLVHGRTFFDLRPSIAQGLYARADYREWVLEQMEREAQSELALLHERLLRLAPDRTEEELRAAVLQTDEARELLARAAKPALTDAEKHLTAWLGDLPAHDLFVRWEAEQIVELVGGIVDRDFAVGWAELRRVFRLPSYTRTLTLLSPVRDRATDRIGFWRVILPRLGWLKERVKRNHRLPEFTDLPLDLVPDAPLGYWVVRRLLEDDPELAIALRDRNYEAATVHYELLGKPRKFDPVRAFGRARVSIELGGSRRDDEPFRIVAETKLVDRGGRRVPQLVRVKTGADRELSAR